MANKRRQSLTTLVSTTILLSACGPVMDVPKIVLQAQKYLEQGQPDRAQEILGPALRRLGHDNAAELDRAKLLVCLGDAYRQGNKAGDAEASFKEAIVIYDRQLGTDSLEAAAPLLALAKVYERDEQFAAAEKTSRQALSILDKHVKPDDPRLEPAINAVLSVACRSGRCLDEIDLDKRLVALRSKLLGADHPYTLAARVLLAEASMHHKNYAQAIELYGQNLDSARRTRSDNLTSALINLGHALDAAGKPDEGLKLVDQAADIQIKQPRLLFPQQLIGTLHLRGQILFDMGRYSQALDNDALLVDKAKKLYGPDNPVLADFYVAYAEALTKTGKAAQAKAMQAEAERLYSMK